MEDPLNGLRALKDVLDDDMLIAIQDVQADERPPDPHSSTLPLKMEYLIHSPMAKVVCPECQSDKDVIYHFENRSAE